MRAGLWQVRDVQGFGLVAVWYGSGETGAIAHPFDTLLAIPEKPLRTTPAAA